MKQLLAVIAILLLLAAVGMYAAGWLKFDREPGRATIEINTQKVEAAAEDAAKSGRELVNQAADSVEQATDEKATRVEVDAASPSAPY